MVYQAALAGGVLDGAAEDEDTGDEQTGEGAGLLMWAAAQADGETVEEILRDEAEKENINATDAHGWTAMHYALHVRNTSGLEALLNNGADPNVTDGRNMSALSYAAIAAFPEGLRLLLEHGADPNAADCYGRTPLFYILDTLDMPDADMRHEALKLLLEHKADPEVKDLESVTPLSLAEAKADGSAEIMKTFNAGR